MNDDGRYDEQDSWDQGWEDGYHEAEVDLREENEIKLGALREALSKLQTYDTEMGHVEADRLLIEFIDDPTVTRLFDNLSKWYA